MFPAPMQVALPPTARVNGIFGCKPDIMQKNLKVLQALKWEIDGVKMRPYQGLKILLQPPRPIDQPRPPRGETKTVSQMAMLSSFLMDKQLRKMLQLQTPLSVGSTMFRDVLEKMNLTPLIQKHMVQCCYLEIAFLQVSTTATKSQRAIQRDLEMKTIQSFTAAILRAFPRDLYSRTTFDQILESNSTAEVNAKMEAIAAKMAWKTPIDAEAIKQKFTAFLDEIKEPDFNWPVKYSLAEKTINALNTCWTSDDYINYVIDYVSDVWFHCVYHAKLTIHMVPWLALDRELVQHVNHQLRHCKWKKSLPPRQQLDQTSCTAVVDMAQDHQLIKIPVTNFVEVTKGSRVFDLDVLGALFNEDMFQHQTDLVVPSEYEEGEQAQEVVDRNNAILSAQEALSQADDVDFQSGEVTNELLQLAQEDLQQVPPCSSLIRLGKASRITIRAAVAASQRDTTPTDLDLMSLFTFHLQPSEDREASSFLSTLSVADDANTQRILVNAKSRITGYQPEKVPMACLYEIRIPEKVKVNGVETIRTVYKKCTGFACTGLPVCPLHLHTMPQLGRHDKFTPGMSFHLLQ